MDLTRRASNYLNIGFLGPVHLSRPSHNPAGNTESVEKCASSPFQISLTGPASIPSANPSLQRPKVFFSKPGHPPGPMSKSSLVEISSIARMLGDFGNSIRLQKGSAVSGKSFFSFLLLFLLLLLLLLLLPISARHTLL